MLGGEPDLIGRFAELSGGYDFLRAEHDRIAEDHFRFGWESVSSIRLGCAVVGWDPPTFLNDEKPEPEDKH